MQDYRWSIVVMWCGKTEGVLCAFQDFVVPRGGKKTRKDVNIYTGCPGWGQTQSDPPMWEPPRCGGCPSWEPTVWAPIRLGIVPMCGLPWLGASPLIVLSKTCIYTPLLSTLFPPFRFFAVLPLYYFAFSPLHYFVTSPFHHFVVSPFSYDFVIVDSAY